MTHDTCVSLLDRQVSALATGLGESTATPLGRREYAQKPAGLQCHTYSPTRGSRTKMRQRPH